LRSILRIACSIISVAAFTMVFLTASSSPVHAATLSHPTAGVSGRVQSQLTGGGCGTTYTNSSNGASASYYTCLGDAGTFGLDGQLTVSFNAHSTPLFTTCLVSMSIVDDTTKTNISQQNFDCTSQAKQGLQQQVFHLYAATYNSNDLFFTLGYVNYVYNGSLSYGGDAYSHDLCASC
jgi:hypothetical protein